MNKVRFGDCNDFYKTLAALFIQKGKFRVVAKCYPTSRGWLRPFNFTSRYFFIYVNILHMYTCIVYIHVSICILFSLTQADRDAAIVKL